MLFNSNEIRPTHNVWSIDVQYWLLVHVTQVRHGLTSKSKSAISAGWNRQIKNVRRKMGPLRWSQAQKIMGNAGMRPLRRPEQIFTLQRLCSAFGGRARCGLLWAVETECNHHRGSVSNAIDAFKPSIEEETATVPRETRQSYHQAWQCSAICCKTGQDILGNVEIGGISPHAVLSRCCSFWLSWSQKVDRFMDRLKRYIVFLRWYPTIARKMEKSSG